MVNLIHDGRFSFGSSPFYDCIQSADITFTMVNEENGFVKVSEAPCHLKLIEDEGCVEKYMIVYEWKPMDVNEKGRFKGTFDIQFSGLLVNEEGSVDEKGNEKGIVYPKGNLIVPIIEPIIITVL